MFGLSLSQFGFLFREAQRKNNEELVHFTDYITGQAWVMTAQVRFNVLAPHFWRRVRADYKTFPSCAFILFFVVVFFTYFSLLLSHSILFFSYPTPTLPVLHLFVVSVGFSLLHGCWLPEIIGGQGLL